MTGGQAARAIIVTCLGLLAYCSCGEDTGADDALVEAATGAILGFTAPIDVSVGEVVVFAGDEETARVEFRDGQFHVEGLAAGVYRLEVRVFGYQVNDAARDIALGQGETIDLGRFILVGDGDLMADIPRVRGVVTDSATGAPLADVSVSVTCSAGVCSVQTAVTAADGSFEALAPTEQEVQVSFVAEGHTALFLTVAAIAAGQVVTLNPELAPDPR